KFTFGQRPKVNLMDSKGNICNDFNDGKSCIECNVNALSLPMVHVMQSYPYRYLKDSSIVKSLRKIKAVDSIDEVKEKEKKVSEALDKAEEAQAKIEAKKNK
ncbi:hypothetical protein ACT4UL_28110, partial [Bacillus sp. HC-TM]